jgi:DNA-binding transcriptional regulator YdaS (Cro superfamily)
MNWNEEVERLQTAKQNEERNNRLELVADEISELQELENEFAITGPELNQNKQTLAEVTARNSPVIEQLTKRLNELKTAIKEIDVEMYLQGVVINNASLEVARQQSLCNSLAASKDEGELEFALYMSSRQTLIELNQNLETEKGKLKHLNNKFYELKAVPAIATIDRRIQQLKTETLDAQNRVANVELDRRAINARMNFLRATLAKTEANVAV